MHEFIANTDIQLHGVADGPRDAPHIVFVHGFPDSHRTWTKVMAQLSGDFRTIAYDVRGAGLSQAPPSKRQYRICDLTEDLIAVLDAASDAPVHLVGHDWGSVQLWAILKRQDPRLAGRIASFTSISGPPLGQYARFLRRALPGVTWREVLDQMRRSWYIGAFQIPLLPDLVLRHAGQFVRRQIERSQHLPGIFADSFHRDAANGINLYRVNRPEPADFQTLQIPTQLIVPTRDMFLSVPLLDAVERVEKIASRVDIAAGHWVIHSHCEAIAEAVRGFIAVADRMK